MIKRWEIKKPSVALKEEMDKLEIMIKQVRQSNYVIEVKSKVK